MRTIVNNYQQTHQQHNYTNGSNSNLHHTFQDPRTSSDFSALIAKKAAEKRAKFQEQTSQRPISITYQPDGSKILNTNNKHLLTKTNTNTNTNETNEHNLQAAASLANMKDSVESTLTTTSIISSVSSNSTNTPSSNIHSNSSTVTPMFNVKKSITSFQINNTSTSNINNDTHVFNKSNSNNGGKWKSEYTFWFFFFFK